MSRFYRCTLLVSASCGVLCIIFGVAELLRYLGESRVTNTSPDLSAGPVLLLLGVIVVYFSSRRLGGLQAVSRPSDISNEIRKEAVARLLEALEPCTRPRNPKVAQSLKNAQNC
jgi:hypothetical protein